MKKILLLATVPMFLATSPVLAGDYGCKKNKYMARMLHRLDDDQKKRVFKAIDENKDGKISEKEFEEGMDNIIFILKDKDGDGTLSQKEFFKKR